MKEQPGYICKNAWTSLFVWGNGDVTHCCYSNIGPLGNINQQTIDEIWNSKKLENIRMNISTGNYLKAGCEQFCRPYKWNEFYGNDEVVKPIPEGLGRIEKFDITSPPESPLILGMAMDWMCNFKCTHCRSPRNVKGLSEDNLKDLWPYISKASIVRFVDGEFSINKRSLEKIKEVSKIKDGPTLFMNTNGHKSIDDYWDEIKDLDSFHLKFSLEGINDNFEKVRVGGKWERFEKNLIRANVIFEEQTRKGKDWKLYLNFCIMKTNFIHFPKVVTFAKKYNIRLVVNPIHGMRYIDENFSMYSYLVPPKREIEIIDTRIKKIINESDYIFKDEFLLHWDYIKRILSSPKLNLPYLVVKFLRKYVKGLWADRFFYILYKWKINKVNCIQYVYRKTIKFVGNKVRNGRNKYKFRKRSSI